MVLEPDIIVQLRWQWSGQAGYSGGSRTRMDGRGLIRQDWRIVLHHSGRPETNAADMQFEEAAILSAFDSNRTLIYAIATKIYSRGTKGSHNIIAADLQGRRSTIAAVPNNIAAVRIHLGN